MGDFQKSLCEFIKNFYPNIEERFVSRGHSYLWSGSKRFHIYRFRNDGSFRYLIYTPCTMNMSIARDVKERKGITIYEGYVRNRSDLNIAMDQIREERECFQKKQYFQSNRKADQSIPSSPLPSNQDIPILSPLTPPNKHELDECIGKYIGYICFIKEINKCNKCYGKNNVERRILLGWGDLNAEIMFIGIAPGKKWGGKGMVFGPYNSKSGHPIMDVLKGIKRSNDEGYTFWITNCIKCTLQSNNIVVEGNESECNEIIKKEVDLIKPNVIVLFGDKTIRSVGRLEKGWSRPCLYKLSNDDKFYINSYHPCYLSNSGWSSEKKYRYYLELAGLINLAVTFVDERMNKNLIQEYVQNATNRNYVVGAGFFVVY